MIFSEVCKGGQNKSSLIYEWSCRREFHEIYDVNFYTKVNQWIRGQSLEEMQTSLDHIRNFSIFISKINEVFSFEHILNIFDTNQTFNILIGNDM